MKFSVFSRSVVGYKNEIKDKTSQDYLKFENIKNGIMDQSLLVSRQLKF